MSNTLMSIESNKLDSVTGGTGRAPASTRSGGTDAALTAQLTGLSDSIKDLAKPQANNSSNTMMMFAMVMALSRPAPAAGVVYVGRRGCW